MLLVTVLVSGQTETRWKIFMHGLERRRHSAMRRRSGDPQTNALAVFLETIARLRDRARSKTVRAGRGRRPSPSDRHLVQGRNQVGTEFQDRFHATPRRLWARYNERHGMNDVNP